MKKLISSIAFALVCLPLVCFGESAANEKSVMLQSPAEVSPDEAYARRQKSLVEERRRKKEAETEKIDEALGVKFHTENYYVLSGDFLKIEFFGNQGTFGISCISNTSKGKKEVPLLSSADWFSNTAFLLRVDGVVHQLVNSNVVKKELRRLENAAQLVYRFENRLRLVLEFSLIASTEGEPEDIIKVRAITLNEGKSSHDVEVRGIFDTICGETSSVHFITENNLRIRNETRFLKNDMQKERAIVSSNGFVSCQFVLDGYDVTPVSSVTLASISGLHRMDWDSGFRKGRGFTNIRAYDDSGVMIAWPSFPLDVNDSHEIVFYIAVADREKAPRGLYYVDKNLYPEHEKIESAEEPDLNSKKRSDVEFIVPPIKDYQLDPDYIQRLIDKIDSLQSSKDVNKKELMRLNAELDAILEKLRRR
ncbi:hypothetical protein [uncultured Treponema sp.]|uniref:hypothetical protein n=1 Tax=uncultured Treponema sp. TaxID=162155 RepID=UPI0025FFDFDD|nr:hypothetical protein [uncultured Treponema sp.]